MDPFKDCFTTIATIFSFSMIYRHDNSENWLKSSNHSIVGVVFRTV